MIACERFVPPSLDDPRFYADMCARCNRFRDEHVRHHAHVIVTGGRDYQDATTVFSALRALSPAVVIHGGATGADSFARSWAKMNGIEERCYMAEWDKHGRYAGPMRNQKILDSEKYGVVLAFPGGAGTADMVRRAKKAGRLVLEVCR